MCRSACCCGESSTRQYAGFISEGYLVDDSKYDALKIDRQLCFPLYAASREIIRTYRPSLDRLGLTYTQYITMMVVWERRKISAKELGEKLFLDSGTLTPVLKCLEGKGYIKRSRSSEDERLLMIVITDAGDELKEQALFVPGEMSKCVRLSKDEAATLYKLLYKLLDK